MTHMLECAKKALHEAERERDLLTVAELEARPDDWGAHLARAALLAAFDTDCDDTFEAVQSAVALALQEDVDDQPLAVTRAVFATIRSMAQADDGPKQDRSPEDV